MEGYRMSPLILLNNEEYVKFQVDYWQNLKQKVIRPVHYGVSSYVITTINILKEAKELPELFMKSKNELVLWRMLRRVSDQIKVTLDKKNIDEATTIDSYFIKDITIQIEKETREMVFKKENEEIKISVDVLEKQPSRVFKLLLQLMER